MRVPADEEEGSDIAAHCSAMMAGVVAVCLERVLGWLEAKSQTYQWHFREENGQKVKRYRSQDYLHAPISSLSGHSP